MDGSPRYSAAQQTIADLADAHAAGDWTRLETLAHRAIADYPRLTPPRLRLAQALAGQDRTEAAYDALVVARQDGVADPALDTLSLELLAQLGRDVEMLELGRKLLDAPQPLPFHLADSLRHAAERHDDTALIIDLCAEVLAQRPGQPRWTRHMAQTLSRTCTPEALLPSLDWLLFDHLDSPENARLLPEVLGVLGVDAVDLAPLLDKAAARWPEAPRVVAARQEIDLLTGRTPTETQDRNTLTLDAAVHGALAALFRRGSIPQHLEQAVLAQLAPLPRQRPLIARDDGAAVVVSPRAETPRGTVVVVNNGRFQTALWELLLAPLGLTGLYLMDSSRMFGANGIPALGPDIDSTVTALTRMLPPGPVTLVATSGCGFGAANLAARMPVDRLLLLGPALRGDRPFLDAIDDHRGNALMARIEAAAHSDAVVPVPALRQMPPRETVTVHCADNPIDARHAAELEGLPGLRQLAIPNSASHNVLFETLQRGILLPLLAGDTDSAARAAIG